MAISTQDNYMTEGGPAQPVTLVNQTLTSDYKRYTGAGSGELQGSATALQLPNIACSLVRFKARSDNAGSVYVGITGVTLPNNTTDTTTGLELDAGDDTGWIPIDNLNRFFRICDNAGDDLTYLYVV